MGLRLMLAGCAITLAACSPSGSDFASEAEARHLLPDAPAAASHEQKAPARLAGSSPGKPGARIALGQSEYAATPGTPAELVLSLVSPETEGELHVSIIAGDGLSILAGATRTSFILGTQPDYTIPLQVAASENGRFYLHIHAVIESGGRQTFRALSAAFQAGAPASAANLGVKQQKRVEGQAIIALPAQETIVYE